LAGSAPAASVPRDSDPPRPTEGDAPRYRDWERLATDGFDHHGNDYAWSSEVYRGRLYIGTLNLLTGGQIWRSDEGESWEMVEGLGFDNVFNEGIRTLIEFGGVLYAGTNNPTTGPEIWRTLNGRDWQQTAFPSRFGDLSVRSAVVFQERLYVGVWNQLSGGSIWRSDDGDRWERVARNGLGRITNQDFSQLAVFRGDDGFENLYAGTLNVLRGAALYRSDNGDDFELVMEGGFGDILNQGIWSAAVHDDWLWLGTMNALFEYEVHRSRDGLLWEELPRPDPGSAQNHYAWSMTVFRDRIYLGTLNVLGGAQLYSYDKVTGASELVMRGGFGRVTNYGVRSLEVFGDELYAGTANPHDGLEMWRSPTAYPIRPQRRARLD